jgi:hypothetical protein
MKGNYFPWCISIFLLPKYLRHYYNDTAITGKLYGVQKRVMAHYETHIGSDWLVEDTRPFTFYPWDTAYMDWLATDRTMDIQVTNGLLCMELAVMAENAGLLGEEADKKHYLDLLEKMKKAITGNSTRFPVRKGRREGITVTYSGTASTETRWLWIWGLPLPICTIRF